MSSLSGEQDQFQDLCRRFSRVGAPLLPGDEPKLAKTCEILKDHLRSKAQVLIREAGHQPVLLFYSSDATPKLLMEEVNKILEGMHGRTRGQELHEFLMERLYVKVSRVSGREEIAIVPGEPRNLSHGKSHWHLLQANTEFFSGARLEGHLGIAVTVLAADRAVLTALARDCEQRTEALYDEEVGLEWGDSCDELYLTDWFLYVGCALHDTNNGLKWAASQAGAPDIHKDIFIGVESLRNAHIIIVKHIRSFLLQFVVFDSDPEQHDAAAEYWTALGVDAVMVSELAAINPFWDGQKLHVNSSLRGDPDAMERVSAAMVQLFKWKQATDSRFVTTGPSFKAVLASMSCGLHKVVALTREDPHFTDYHLHGFSRFKDPHVKYMAIVGMSSFYADSVSCAVFEDDRLVKRFAELEVMLHDEIEYLCGLSHFVWERLATLCNATAQSLRNGALHSMHVSAAYIDRKVTLRSFSSYFLYAVLQI